MCVASTGFAVINSIKDDSQFIYFSLFQEYVLGQMISAMGKGAYPSINQNDVNNLKLAMPSKELQTKIVANIKEEICIVNQSKRLIEIFEQKIKNKISEVWGE